MPLCNILYIYIYCTCVCITSVEGPVPEGARKFLVYSLHDNAIGTKHIGGAPHQNYDLGPSLALDSPGVYYNINI